MQRTALLAAAGVIGSGHRRGNTRKIRFVIKDGRIVFDATSHSDSTP